MSKKYVLDACSVIAFLADEEGADTIEKLVHEAIDKDTSLFMNKLNLYEVLYDMQKSQGESEAIDTVNSFISLPVAIIDIISDDLMIEAAYFKTNYSVSVADSFALATAKIYDAALVTSDHHEFDPVDKIEEITFLWIR